MATQTSYPGVYIEEFAPAAPIEGVGTGNAAFIGVAERGDLDTPTKLTSWDQFRETFGEQPVPGFYLWHAVRGFFANGGQVCIVVRASDGTYGTGEVHDRTQAQNPIIRVRARQPGAMAITVAVLEKTQLASANTQVYRPTGTITGGAGTQFITLNWNDGRQFRAGDFVAVAAIDRVAVLRATRTGPDEVTLRLDVPLSPGTTLRLADAPAGTRMLRIHSTVPIPAGVLVPGTILTIQGQPESVVVESVQVESLDTGLITHRLTFRQGLKLAQDMTVAATVQSEEFDLTVTLGASTVYANLSMDSAHPRYFARIVNDDPAGAVKVSLVEPPPAVAWPDGLPETQPVTWTPGLAENLANLADETPQHDIHFADALETLRSVDDVNLVAAPDRRTPGFQQDIITHCEQLADRFAVLDAQPALNLFSTPSIGEQRLGLDSTRGYAALYYPWLRVAPAGPGDLILVPPSGHVCGIIARTDLSKGVHKAPANEIVNGALGVERSMSDIDQGQLNIQGINVIRQFAAGGRPMLWGARTTATDTNWRYVNVRRLFLFLEESIQEGVRGSVFEPNNPGLWASLHRTLTEFLTRVWHDGALFGNTAKEAFYVRIDETLNPDSTRALGRLYIEIGVRPSYPAEFIIVRIGIWQGGSEVSEI